MPRANLAAAALLALQVGWIVHEQLGASRYFCWAPLHEHVLYEIEAHTGGRRLSHAEVALRYGRRGALDVDGTRFFWELNAAQHVLDTVARRERSLHPSVRAEVTVRYRVNGRQEQTWTFAP